MNDNKSRLINAATGGVSELAPSEPMTVTVSINSATLSIMSYSTFLASWPQPELKSSEAKQQTYTGEEIAVTESDMIVKYNQEANLIITVVGGDGPTLLG